MAQTKKRAELTLSDKLSRLNFTQACKLLGPEGASLIQQGGAFDIDIDNDVLFERDVFRLRLPLAILLITLDPASRNRLYWNCSACDTVCEHVGAAFSLILEEKMALGLAVPPPERVPVESLSESELVQLALDEREQRSRAERMTLKAVDKSTPWTDYLCTSALSGKSYRLAIRGWERGESFCSCPDFRSNTLGTCKHIISALRKLKQRFPAAIRNTPHEPTRIAIHLKYGEVLELRMIVPAALERNAAKVATPLKGVPITDVHDLLKRVRKLERLGHDVTIHPDAEEHIQKQLQIDRLVQTVSGIRAAPSKHPLRNTLLNAELLPYQMDGIAFAAGAGRAILADDMGLGKTIQGIGVAELLGREVGIRRVLVICPTSLKSQWRNEIHRFSERDCQLVLGSANERPAQYLGDAFFTICNYEQVLRDILAIERVPWDLIILDEGQRIKNWEAKTTGVVKGLKSRFALVLTGTPLENRLDDLYSIVQFIDDRQLGPAFRFFNQHRKVDEKGKVLGYRNLSQVRKRLQPILLRRTRAQVMKELPERTTEIVRIPATEEQLDLHGAHMRVVSSIVRKAFISEMDLLRLQKALLMCRRSANSTYLVDRQEPGYSSKLEHLSEILGELAAEEDRKIVLFSEWTSMLDLIEPIADAQGLRYVRLDGSVPQKKRQGLVREFQDDPKCRLFMTTNAGSTGLNLQAANTVINVELPWNPAVLEQRIARAHRMGQKRRVQVYVLITEGTIEENLLHTLSAKHSLALAALDVESQVDEVDMKSGMDELKSRLEILLGARPEAEVDVSQKSDREAELARSAQRERMSAAGGELMGAAFAFLGEMLPAPDDSVESKQMTDMLRTQLTECLERGEDGRIKLSVTLPDESVLNTLATALSGLLARNAKTSGQGTGMA